MDAQQERRWNKLKILPLAILLFVVGTMALAPVQIYRSVLDSEGQPTYRADGREIVETDHWGNFKVNWVGYTLIYSGVAVLVWGVGGWLHAGFTPRRAADTK